MATNLCNNTQDHKLVTLIQDHGYPTEIYENVRSEDGYFLTLYRIPHGKTNKKCNIKPVVLLMHGVPSNSADFVAAGPDRALGLLLSERGYDVWLYNARGTRASRKHAYLDAEKEAAYWNFSFHEMGLYDLPAILDKIECITRIRTVICIGHSMGTVPPYVLLSERPEYNQRFSLIISLSPFVFNSNLRSVPYITLNATKRIWLGFMEKTGNLVYLPESVTSSFKNLFTVFGKNNSVLHTLTTKALHVLNGKSYQFVKEDLPVLLDFYPDTTSAIVVKHLGQSYTSGKFAKFDYGPQKNFTTYGIHTPPLYNLNRVNCPVVLFCSSADLMSQPEDARKLRDHLPNCIELHEMEEPTFNHSDLLFGKHAVEMVFGKIFEYMDQYSKSK